MTTDLEERELRRIGARVADVLDQNAGRSVPAAHRRLFDDPARSEVRQPGSGGRSIVSLAGAGAVAAIALALRGDPAPASTSDSAESRRAMANEAAAPQPTAPQPTAPQRSEVAGFALATDARARAEARPDGAREVMLESGEVRGIVGPQSQGARAVVAGPYRVTGDAAVLVTWRPTHGLTVQVERGEARVLTPGHTPVVIPAGTTKTLPAQP